MRWRTRRAADQLEIDLPELGKAGKWVELVDSVQTWSERTTLADTLAATGGRAHGHPTSATA